MRGSDRRLARKHAGGREVRLPGDIVPFAASREVSVWKGATVSRALARSFLVFCLVLRALPRAFA